MDRVLKLFLIFVLALIGLGSKLELRHEFSVL